MDFIHRLFPITQKPFAEWHAKEFGDSIACTPDAAAKYLGVHRNLILQLLEEGIMPSVQPSQYWFMMTADTDAWITDALAAQAERDDSK